MQPNGLRSQYPPPGDALSPRPLYDYPSPTSNYPSYMGGASPGFSDTMYQATPRYGSNAFVPPPDVFLEGRKGSAAESNTDSARGSKTRNTEILHNDPVAMHLLVETAMSDSQSYDILSFEEVEALKKEQQTLRSRIDALQRKLALESKVRDAAQSLNRLYSKKEPKGHRRSFGSRGSKDSFKNDAIAKAEDEVALSSKKCNDLSRDLIQLEARARQIQTQLLQHTAGILQITHEGPSKRNQTSQTGIPDNLAQGGRPDSPASIYTYETGRSNRGKMEDNFDERSLYRSPENLDGLMDALKNGTHHGAIEQQSQALISVEKRLEELNGRLRELIVQANPERSQGYSSAPKSTESPNIQSASLVDQQLDFLDRALRDIGADQSNMRNASKHSLNAIEGRLEGINNQLYAMLSSSRNESASEDYPPPPPISGGGSQEQINYMEEAFYGIEQMHYNMSESVSELRGKASNQKQDSQYEVVLTGLWSIIQAGEEEARQRRFERRQLLAGDPDGESDMSPDEDGIPNEEFSLGAFSTKVQWLYSRATTLKEKQGILRRQIKQQRELNSRSDAQKEAEFSRLREQVNQARSEKAEVERELDRAIAQLEEFDEQRKRSNSETLRGAEDRYQALEAQLREHQDDARIEAAELRAQLSETSSRIEGLNGSLRSATSEKEAAESRATAAAAAVTAKEEELRDLEGEVIRLQTEVTIARAELDGAYGSRAERAAEVAANPTIKKELDDLGAKNAALAQEVESLRRTQQSASQQDTAAGETVRNLKQELAAMAQEYEALTRDSIQNEKDRDHFEAMIDALRDEKEALEMELSDERVRWLGVRSPGGPNGPTTMEATSIRMLREDFRKMMRDRTAEGLKALRAEQEERRKLEALVRSLRREQAPQKSSLSKTMTA